MKAAVWAVVAVLLACAGQAGAADLVGQPLAAAKASDLFGFFNLAQTGSRPCGGGQALGFRPTGAQFHALASVQAATDARGVVSGLSLSLSRAFVDDRTNGVFARDIAKSFLGAAGGSHADIAALASQIAAGMSGAGGGEASPAYRTYLGGPDYAAISGEVALTLANAPSAGGPVLRIAVVSAGFPAACLAGDVPG